MAIQNGVQPNPYDLRDYSNERTFGSIAPRDLPLEYNSDLALSFPDQNADGYPNGCTGYTQSEIGQDENGEKFDPAYTYKQTLFIENAADGSPVQMRDSFKSTRIYGLARVKTPVTYLKRGAYFDVDKVGDYFDGARSALWQNQLNKRTLSCASPWPWGDSISHTGIIPDFDAKNLPSVWHNYKICGWKMISNVPYLIIKAWCGSGWGNKGYGYMSREIFNKMMNISGTALYVQRNPEGTDVQTVRIDIIELMISLYRRILALMQSQPKPASPDPVPPAPEVLLWDTPENARHSVRVICDQEKLTVDQKNLLSQVVHCESGYNTKVVHPNLDANGKVSTTDYGICQWNDYFHGKEISPEEAVDNPEKAVRLMCQYVKNGQIKQWVCYSAGLYKKYSA